MRVVVNARNALFADLLKSTLSQGGDFTVYVVEKPEEVVAAFNRHAADGVLLEVTASPRWTLPERIKLRDAVKRTDPDCKVVILVDENVGDRIADDVKNAKLLGRIDQFIFSSISAAYLIALMETL